MKDTAVHKWQTQGSFSKYFVSHKKNTKTNCKIGVLLFTAKMFHLSIPDF